MATLRIARARAIWGTTSTTTFRVAAMRAQYGSGAVLRVAAMRAQYGNIVSGLSLGADINVEPFEEVTLTADADVVPDTHLFQQITGFDGAVKTTGPNLVTFYTVTTPEQRTFKVPGGFTAINLYFRDTASLGSASSVAEIMISVNAYGGIYSKTGIAEEIIT